MFARHVSAQLPAHCDGTLDAARAERVRTHLDRCARCQREVAQIQAGIVLARGLPAAKAPDALWEGILAALPAQAGQRSANITPVVRLVYAGGAIAVAAAVALALWSRRPAPQQDVALLPGWRVTRVAGIPRVGNSTVRAVGRLAVGQWLETDSGSRAEIKVADIGRVNVEPNSRVRLEETRANAHRLRLDHGGISAHVSAPPRIFLVDTPSATAVDLGCAYTLRVDPEGNGRMRVLTGRVAFVREGRECVVPAGATCLTRRRMGPGTPSFDDAPRSLRDALARFDFESGGSGAITQILPAARKRDAFTIWNLLTRVPDVDRPRVADRLQALVPMPHGVTRGLILKQDSRALDSWLQRIEKETWDWFPRLQLFASFPAASLPPAQLSLRGSIRAGAAISP